MDAFLPGIAGAIMVALVVWVFNPFRDRSTTPRMAADRDDLAYDAYTTAHDRLVWARQVPALLEQIDGKVGPTRSLTGQSPEARLSEAERLSADSGEAFKQASQVLSFALPQHPSSVAISLLVDQSGSMHEMILTVASTVRWLSVWCDERNVPLAVAGFTTAGWRGGEVRKDWSRAGRPEYPGRLCALLHIRYREFDRPMASEDWTAMVHPNALRENVDGEAIEWAASELSLRPESHKLLIVLSDGAPVDDSTLAENGPNFMVRHLREVVARLRSRPAVKLGAVGLEHSVEAFYGRSTCATSISDLPIAIANEIADLLVGRACIAKT